MIRILPLLALLFMISCGESVEPEPTLEGRWEAYGIYEGGEYVEPSGQSMTFGNGKVTMVTGEIFGVPIWNTYDYYVPSVDSLIIDDGRMRCYMELTLNELYTREYGTEMYFERK